MWEFVLWTLVIGVTWLVAIVLTWYADVCPTATAKILQLLSGLVTFGLTFRRGLDLKTGDGEVIGSVIAGVIFALALGGGLEKRIHDAYPGGRKATTDEM